MRASIFLVRFHLLTLFLPADCLTPAPTLALCSSCAHINTKRLMFRMFRNVWWDVVISWLLVCRWNRKL